MSDKSDLTCKEFLDAIVAKISVEAKKPELFTKYGEWNKLTSGLKELVEELNEKNDADKRQVIMLKRDVMVGELIILMRNQFVHSYLFDDLRLQHSLGCTLLSDYANLKIFSMPELVGHKFDGIKWNAIELRMMPDHPKKRFDFMVNKKGSTGPKWEYCSCLDHVITNLIYVVWGHSDVSKAKARGEEKFQTTWWKDASMYLAVLLCFGDNILDDQTFLEKIGANPNEADTPQEKLRKVLNADDIHGKLWERIQELIPNRG